MEPTSLEHLLRKEEGITCTPSGLVVVVSPQWVVQGEDRLSYTSIIRLIECCREHHWNIDVRPNTAGNPIDSITKSISCDFVRPIPVGTSIQIGFKITEVRRRSYALEFQVRALTEQTLYATAQMISVFYDPVAGIAAYPPDSVLNSLVAKCQ